MNIKTKSLVLIAILIIVSIALVFVIKKNYAECTNCSVPKKNYSSQCASVIACLQNQRNFCAEAERAADRRISFWQDPSVSEEYEREYQELKQRCLEQNSGYVFEDEDQLPAQEMTEISF